MRVIAGTAKGTRLYGAKGCKVRPVLDRVKESLFDLLGDTPVGSRVLDLYAGVGSLGIEALSRGAEHADFIEQHRATATAIIDNLERSHLAERARVYASRLPQGLARVSGRYGLIFVDPPFRIDTRLLDDLFARIIKRRLLEPGGIIVYRQPPRSTYEPPATGLSLAERRDYGDSIISMYRLTD
jgi:16S rRNA (guanine966-N2)-methyltransferase